MSTLKKPFETPQLTTAELEDERAQLLALRRKSNVNTKLIDLALQSDAPRMTLDEINEYLGRNRGDEQ